jgi:hypothetical protein
MHARIVRLAAGLAVTGLTVLTNAALSQTQPFQPTYEDGVGRSGQDYRSFHPIGPSALYCQQACLTETKCHAWAYASPSVRGDKQPMCWLKISVPPPTKAQGIVSGIVRPDEPGTDTAAAANTNVAAATPPAAAPAPNAAPATPTAPQASSSATAEVPKPGCVTDRYTFSTVQSQSVSVNAVSTAGAACAVSVAPLHPDVVTFTSARIIKKPDNGTFQQVGVFAFRYLPAGGFKGLDQYAIEVCGQNKERSGCATITYHVTVQ